MSFPEAVRDGFRRFAVFKGRSSRSQFWWWILFQFLTLLAGATLGFVSRGGVLAAVFSLWLSFALWLPTLAVSVRRLHDTGRSGLTYLWGLIPFVGPLILIAFFVGPSYVGPNEWGHHPSDPNYRPAGRTSPKTVAVVLNVALVVAIVVALSITSTLRCEAMTQAQLAEIVFGEDGRLYSSWKGEETPEITGGLTAVVSGQSYDEVWLLGVHAPADGLFRKTHVFVVQLAPDESLEQLQGADLPTRNWWIWGDDVVSGSALDKQIKATLANVPACTE